MKTSALQAIPRVACIASSNVEKDRRGGLRVPPYLLSAAQVFLLRLIVPTQQTFHRGVRTKGSDPLNAARNLPPISAYSFGGR